MSKEQSNNPVQDKINELVKEREHIIKAIKTAESRLWEINGSIQTLVELFGKNSEEGANNDSENKINTGSSVDEN